MRERGRRRESQGYVQCVYFRKHCVSYHPVNADKVFGFLGPSRKLHIAHGDAIVTYPELILVAVDEHLRQIVEFWDQLLMGTMERDSLFEQNSRFSQIIIDFVKSETIEKMSTVITLAVILIIPSRTYSASSFLDNV